MRLGRCAGVNGALRRVLACGCPPLPPRYAHPIPGKPQHTSSCPLWMGNGGHCTAKAGSRQAPQGRVSRGAASWPSAHCDACRRAFCTVPATRRAVTAHRSDGPPPPARNMGLGTFLLFAACVTMPTYTGPARRQVRWALYIGIPKDAGSCKRLPTQGGTIPRHAQAPPHAAPTHGAEPFFSGCSRHSCAHGALFLWPRFECNAR